MALSIKDDEADRLARELARYTGESLTQVVIVSLRERLSRLKPPSTSSNLVEEIGRIGRRVAGREQFDHRTPEEILGYDESGLPS